MVFKFALSTSFVHLKDLYILNWSYVDGTSHQITNSPRCMISIFIICLYIWIHTFSKGISVMRNAISLVQDLNSCRRVHILRR